MTTSLDALADAAAVARAGTAEARVASPAVSAEARVPSPAVPADTFEPIERYAAEVSCQEAGCLRLATYRLDPRDQAHLDAAAREPAQAAALRRHFDEQIASTRALLACRHPSAAGVPAFADRAVAPDGAAADGTIPAPRKSRTSGG